MQDLCVSRPPSIKTVTASILVIFEHTFIVLYAQNFSTYMRAYTVIVFLIHRTVTAAE